MKAIGSMSGKSGNGIDPVIVELAGRPPVIEREAKTATVAHRSGGPAAEARAELTAAGGFVRNILQGVMHG
jgi:hypothetical protein